MKYTAAILAALAARVSAKSEPAAVATPQVTPPGEGSSECHQSVKGPLKLTVVEEKKEKRGIDQLEPANCDESGLILTLADGILKDQASRTGYISANYQLQFDDPPQSGAIAGDGFAVCPDGNLSLRGSTTFFECPTGADAWNLYDRNWAEHCGPVRLVAKRCGGEGEVAEVSGETTVVPTKVITEMEDGQARVKTTEVGKVICQLEDGQVRGRISDCVNTAKATGTGTSGAPTATSVAHNHTTSAPAPEGTSDIEEEGSGTAGLAFHASAACVGLAVSYLVMAAVL
ncbi:hypothetical protein VUR80DRAFT_2440 [Thermomyces stellatus]